MVDRPQDIGIKAIELYFPSQVGTLHIFSQDLASQKLTLSIFSVLIKSSSRSSMASALENTPLVWARPK
jgi:hypothetical protein